MQTQTKEELQAKLKAANDKKAKLEAEKRETVSINPDSWTQQAELEAAIDEVLAAEDALAAFKDEAPAAENKQPKKNGKQQPKKSRQFKPNRVYLLLRRGENKFDPKTGEPLHNEYEQSFSYGEWQSFKNNFTKLGYQIAGVVFDPWKEADKYVTK